MEKEKGWIKKIRAAAKPSRIKMWIKIYSIMPAKDQQKIRQNNSMLPRIGTERVAARNQKVLDSLPKDVKEKVDEILRAAK